MGVSAETNHTSNMIVLVHLAGGKAESPDDKNF
jgi:hypothetical protein